MALLAHTPKDAKYYYRWLLAHTPENAKYNYTVDESVSSHTWNPKYYYAKCYYRWYCWLTHLKNAKYYCRWFCWLRHLKMKSIIIDGSVGSHTWKCKVLLQMALLAHTPEMQSIIIDGSVGSHTWKMRSIIVDGSVFFAHTHENAKYYYRRLCWLTNLKMQSIIIAGSVGSDTWKYKMLL